MENKTPKNPSVELLRSIVNPAYPSVATITLRVDLTRPGQLTKDFRAVIREIPAMPSRAMDPRLYEALALAEKEQLSFRQASVCLYGDERKKSALQRLNNALLNAAVDNAKR